MSKSFYAGGIRVAEMVREAIRYLHQDALGSTVLAIEPSLLVSHVRPRGERYVVTDEKEHHYTRWRHDSKTWPFAMRHTLATLSLRYSTCEVR